MNERLGQALAGRAATSPSTEPPATVASVLAQTLDVIRQCHAITDRLEVQILGPHPSADVQKETEPSGVADAALRARSALLVLAERLDKLSSVI